MSGPRPTSAAPPSSVTQPPTIIATSRGEGADARSDGPEQLGNLVRTLARAAARAAFRAEVVDAADAPIRNPF